MIKYSKKLLRRYYKFIILVVIIIIIICIGYIYVFNYENTTNDIYSDMEINSETRDGICRLEESGNYVEPADIESSQLKTTDKHTMNLNITELPHEHKIKVELNGNLIDELSSNKTVKYNVSSNDSFVVTQISENGSEKEHISIKTLD